MNQSGVVIKADKDVGHGRVVAVMDAARSRGLTQLAIATEVNAEGEAEVASPYRPSESPRNGACASSAQGASSYGGAGEAHAPRTRGAPGSELGWRACPSF